MTENPAPVTETVSAPAEPIVAETSSSPEVAKPFTSQKPYDDDMLEVYAEEGEAEGSEKAEEPKALAEKPEETEAPKEAEQPKAKADDKIIDGIEEVPLKKIINGKEVEFKIKDAVQAYVKQEEFNRDMHKRLTSVSKREQAWINDQAQFKNNLSELIKVAQGGDFVTAIRGLAKVAMAGSPSSDVVEFEKKYFDQLDKVREVYTKMTPVEREAYFAKRALAEAQERAKALEDEKTATAEKSQLQEHVTTLQKQHGLDEQEFWDSYKTLKDNLVGEGKDFKDASQIRAEDVVEFSLQVRHEEKVFKAAEKVGLKDEAILSEVSRITATNPNITVDDIVKVIESAGLAKKASPQAVENLNRKAGKSRLGQASSTKKGNDKIEGYDEETLNDLYRKAPKAYARPVR